MENLKGIDIASNKVCETMFGKRSNLSVDDIEMFDEIAGIYQIWGNV